MPTILEEITKFRSFLTESEAPRFSLKWKVSAAPTGKYRSFDKRTWPSASYMPSDSPAVNLMCDDRYDGHNSKREDLDIKIGIADWSNPSNKETGNGFTWRYLKQRATSLAQAKQLAQDFLKNHPEWAPKESQISGRGVLESTEPSHDLHDGIEAGMKRARESFSRDQSRRAKKIHNASMLFYYMQLRKKLDNGSLTAFNSYETWIGSQAGNEWLKKNSGNIQELVDDLNHQQSRFGKAVTNWTVDKPKQF